MADLIPVPAWRVKKRAYDRARYQRIREDRLAYQRWYRETFPEKAREGQRRAREKARVYRNAQKRAHWKANRAREMERARRYQAAHAEELSAKARARYAANRDTINARVRAYARAHPEKIATVRAIRRARIRGAMVERVDRAAIYARDGGQCWACGCGVTLQEVAFDHLLPLARGGEEAMFNVAVSCRPCNAAKHAKLIPGALALRARLKEAA